MPQEDKNKKKSSAVEKLETTGRVLERAGDIFEQFLGTGGGVPGGGTPAQIGTAPAMLAAPPMLRGRNLAAGTPVSSPVQAPVPAARGFVEPGTFSTGVEFGTRAGKRGAIVAGAISNISRTIHEFRNKKEQGEIAKAQNWYNVYEKALDQGDMWTANLYATDPKILKAWEKWLKLDFKKVPTVSGHGMSRVDIPSAGVPVAALGSPQQPGVGTTERPSIPGAVLPAPPGTPGDINMPGGIAVARPGGAAQLDQMRINLLTEMAQREPEKFLAMTTPRGELAAVSNDEFRTAVKAQLGLELTPFQTQQLSQRSKQAMLELQVDVRKFLVNREYDYAIAAMQGKNAQQVAGIHEAGRLAAIREQYKNLKSIQGMKGGVEATALLAMQRMYASMAEQTNQQLGIYTSKREEVDESDTVVQNLRRLGHDYMRKAEAISNELEALKAFSNLGIDVSGETPPDKEP